MAPAGGFEPLVYRLGIHPRAVFWMPTKSNKFSVFKAFQSFYCPPLTRFSQLRTGFFKWFLRRVLRTCSHKSVHSKNKIDKSQKDDIKFDIAGKNTAKTLDATKKSLNLITLFVQFLIVVPYRGLTQVSNWVRLKFAAMNLKKLARWKTKRQRSAPFPPLSFYLSILHFAACLVPSRSGRFSTS